MPELDRKALKEAALKSNDGAKWVSRGSSFEIRELNSSCGGYAGTPERAAFIALANPATILSLLASLEEAEGRANYHAEDSQQLHEAHLAHQAKLTARAEAAEQRERRLRETLTKIRDDFVPFFTGDDAVSMANIARAALSEEEA